MSIRGSNFENQHPFASDHALIWAYCMPDGLLYGVEMSFTSSLFTLAPGFMLVAGRVFEITAVENISISPGAGYARVYVAIDTGGTASENSFNQVSFGVDYAANLDSFADLTQGEININQGAAVYQAEVAVLAIDNTGITTIERQMELIEPGIGGGGGAIFAVISVSYPEGSICTCSDGVKTFTAKDTSGQALFIIPYAGSWTVTATATDGSGNAKSDIVEITAEGQFANVDIAYELVLYSAGDDGANWQTFHSSSNGYINFNETQVVAYSSSTAGSYAKAAAYYKDSIVGGQYSTLTILAGDTVKRGSGGSTSVGIVTEANLSTVTSGTGVPTCVATVSIVSANNEYALDLSSLTEGEQYYVVFWARGRNLGSDSTTQPSTLTIASMTAE